MSSINKKDLRDVATKFRSDANNSVLKSLANIFAFSIARLPEVTLENTRDVLYNFIVNIKNIRTWEELTDGIAPIVNNTFRAVYNEEDIMTKESFNDYLTTHPLRQSSTESESYDSDTESMGSTGSNINTTGESKSQRPPPRIDPDLLEAMQEAGWGRWGGQPQHQPQLIPHGAPPMLRQTSISELPYDEWAQREVLGATMGPSEDSDPAHSSEIADMMMVEDPVMRQNHITEGELWSDAAHVSRARRYQEEGKPVRQDDKTIMRMLGKQVGKGKTKRKRKTRKRKKTRKKKHKKKTKKRRKNNRKKRTKRRR